MEPQPSKYFLIFMDTVAVQTSNYCMATFEICLSKRVSFWWYHKALCLMATPIGILIRTQRVKVALTIAVSFLNT